MAAQEMRELALSSRVVRSRAAPSRAPSRATTRLVLKKLSLQQNKKLQLDNSNQRTVGYTQPVGDAYPTSAEQGVNRGQARPRANHRLSHRI
eukprot:354523-Chlamydomonas_euryale.AAC.1